MTLDARDGPAQVPEVTTALHDFWHLLGPARAPTLAVMRTLARLRPRDLEVWSGLAVLVLLLAIAVPVLVGAIPTAMPRAGWLAVYALLLVALVGTTWGDGPPWRSWLWLVVAVLAAATVVLTAPPGFVASVLVVVAAVAVYVVPFPFVLGVVAVNIAVVALSGVWTGSSLVELQILTGFYLLLQVAVVLSCLSELRQQRLRQELVQAHVELQAATALLRESARTGERLRISRELHDSLGHGLTVLNLELEAARHREGTDSREHVVRAAETARGLLGEVRTTVGELRSRPVDLRAALEEVVHGIPDLDVSLEVAHDVEVGEDGAAALVRAVQEIVTNTVRHARAERLALTVRQGADGTTVLEAHDDGRGTADLRPGHGLRGMTERFEALGGEVRLDGRSGFRVTARVPAG